MGGGNTVAWLGRVAWVALATVTLSLSPTVTPQASELSEAQKQVVAALPPSPPKPLRVRPPRPAVKKKKPRKPPERLMIERRVRGAKTAVVVLHGLGLAPDNTERRTGLTALGRKYKFDVVYAGGKHLSWNAGWCCGWARDHNVNDVVFLRALVRKLRARGIKRVMLAGFSNGGMMAYKYACTTGRKSGVNAIVVVGGTYEASSRCSYPGRIVHIHGLNDSSVPFQGRGWAKFLEAPLRDVRTIPGLARNARWTIRTLRGVSHIWPVGIVNDILVRNLRVGRR